MTIARPYPERIEELERKLEITRQQYMDADHASNMWHAECRRLRSAMDEQSSEAAAEINDLEAEVGTLRFEATQLMAENANHILALDSLRTERAWLKENAKQQAERIRELEAEVEQQGRAMGLNATDRRFMRAFNGDCDTGQKDLPPTRAEEQATD